MILLNNKDLNNSFLREIVENTSLLKEEFSQLLSTYSISENKKKEIVQFLDKKNKSNSVIRKIILSLELPVKSLLKYKIKQNEIIKFINNNDFFNESSFIDLIIKEYSFSTEDILSIKKEYKKKNIFKSNNFYNQYFIKKIITENKVDNISYLKTLNFSKIKNTREDYYFNDLYYDFIFEYDYTEEERKNLLRYIARSKKVKKINFLYKRSILKEINIDPKLTKAINSKIKIFWKDSTINRLDESSNLYKLEFYFYPNLFKYGNTFKYLIDSHLINKFIDFYLKDKRKINDSNTINLLKEHIYNSVEKNNISYISFLNIIVRLGYNLDFLFFRDKKNGGAEYKDIYRTIELFGMKEQFNIIKYIIKSNKIKETEDFNKWAFSFIITNPNLFNKKDILKLNSDIIINLLKFKLIKLKDIFKYRQDVLKDINKKDLCFLFFKEEKLYLKNININRKYHNIIQYIFYLSAYEDSSSKEAVLFYKNKFKNIIKKDDFFSEISKLNHFIYPKNIEDRKFNLKKEIDYFKGKNKGLLIEKIIELKTVLPSSLISIIKFIKSFENIDIQRFFIEKMNNIIVGKENNIFYNKNIHDSGIKYYLKNKKDIKHFFSENKIKIYFDNMKNHENDFNTFLHRIEDITEKRKTIQRLINEDSLNFYQIKKYKKVIKGNNLNNIHTLLYKFYDDLFAKSVNFKYEDKVVKDFCFIDNEFHFFLPKNSKELRIFGNLMNNCIKGYIDKIINGESYLICIIKKGKPYCNCEITPEKYIREIKLVNNKVLSKEERQIMESNLKYLKFID